MNTRSIISLIIAGGLLGVAGCASDKAQEPAKPAKDERPMEQQLSVGMTKDEVRKALGEPSGNSVDNNGEESWRYSDSAKAFIPFYSISGGRVSVLMVHFDKDGKVKSWSTSKQGMY